MSPNDTEILAKELEQLLTASILSAPKPKAFADMYVIGSVLQFTNHFRAAQVLLSGGFESEAWILVRTMTEILIRVKWAKRNKSNAVWILLGTDSEEANRFRKQGSRSKSKTAAIQCIDQHLNQIKPTLPRNARYWNPKSPKDFRQLPTMKRMAEECGMLKIYWSWFKKGSDHTHSACRVLERFMATDERGEFKHWVLDPIPSDLPRSWQHLNFLVIGLLCYLKKFGWAVDEASLSKITGQLNNSKQ